MKSSYLIFVLSLNFIVFTKKNNDLRTEFSMTWLEKDKILSCVEIIHRKLKKDKVRIYL